MGETISTFLLGFSVGGILSYMVLRGIDKIFFLFSFRKTVTARKYYVESEDLLETAAIYLRMGLREEADSAIREARRLFEEGKRIERGKRRG